MKIAIAGYGQEGESSFRYWSKNKENEITIVDHQKPTRDVPYGVMTIFGEDATENLNGFDLVVRTAGLAPDKIKTDGKIWSSTNEFFAKCPAQIIGVTGTKGKGTTSSLIASIFEAVGRKVWLIGNIGKPSLDYLDEIKSDDIVVFEMSSFQLWDLEYSPHIAVVLMIEPDHLNVHNDFEDYVRAKMNIRNHQNKDDYCVYNSDNLFSINIAKSCNVGHVLGYSVAEHGGVYENDGDFYIGEQKICSVNVLQLLGRHNIENACAAISVAKIYDISNKDIEQGVKSFKGLPYRIEFIREVGGVKYYNDSYSSAPAATVAAIKSFDQPEIVIMGGTDKGANFNEIAVEIFEKGNIKKVVLMGETRHKLAEILRNGNPDLDVQVCNSKDFRDVVTIAKQSAEPGDVVLLSPGCASFDMFNNFSDRGNQFNKIVKSL